MPATEANIDAPPAGRLVIRIKLIPQEPPPARWRVSRTALIGVGVVAVLLSWIGISTFRTESTPPPVVNTVADAPAPAATTPTSSIEPTPVATEVQPPPGAPPSAIHEVVPDAPQSALNTIRGTVRVSIRVTIDQRGKVVTAAVDERGPSRYFERLALRASKQWTFTPAKADEPRAMRLRFNFTRSGTTAQASPLQ